MKNKIFLLLAIIITTAPVAFAVEDAKVVSDSATQKKIIDSFNDVNQYTDNFFTPHIKKEVKVVRDYGKKEEIQTKGTLPPIKKLRLQIKNANALKTTTANSKGKAQSKTQTKDIKSTKVELTKKDEIVTENADVKNQAILDCDLMEYFAQRTELEANGNVVMVFPQNNSTLKADKVVYNQTSNIIKAYGNVVLISDGKELFGDYMKIDMNEENAIMDNPLSDVFQVHAQAKKGYMYGDKIIQEQGSLYVSKKTMIDIKSEMFGPNLDAMFIEEKDKSYYKKDSHGEKFKIKTNELLINSKKEHDTVTLKHAEIYFSERKIGTIPSITMHTNKAQDYLEADFPEIGTTTNLGLFAGPGFVFDTPKGTTLKVVPMINYQSNGDNSSDNKLGWGAIAKFKSATNKTDFAYGTSNEIFIMRGYQKLDDNLILQYTSNSYMDDWFMGFRMPKLMGELVYQDSTPYPDFFGKGYNVNFTHRIAGGYVQDGSPKSPLFDSDGIGSIRFKYMAELAETLWNFNNAIRNPINASIDLVEQGSAAVYGTGNTQFVGRIGPRLHTQYKWWMQDLGYFLSAYDDKTPFAFDRYMYGRSNAYIRESFRVSKYLTLSWFSSLNLLQDSWDGKMMQENSFFFSVGPDDVKLNIGYDTIRQQSFVTMAMHLDAKGTTLEYKKMVIKNPDTLGKNKNENNVNNNNSQSGSFSPSGANYEGFGLDKAEVINIDGAL